MIDFVCRYKGVGLSKIPWIFLSCRMLPDNIFDRVAYGRGFGGGGSNPRPRNSEGSPKSYQTQPDCENC
jgi:hypothetical protein